MNQQFLRILSVASIALVSVFAITSCGKDDAAPAAKKCYVLTETSDDGKVTTYSYDAANNITMMVAKPASGSSDTTWYTYTTDKLYSKRKQSGYYLYDTATMVSGRITNEVSSDNQGYATVNTYDGSGQLIKSVSNSGGGPTTSTYTWSGGNVTKIDLVTPAGSGNVQLTYGSSNNTTNLFGLTTSGIFPPAYYGKAIAKLPVKLSTYVSNIEAASINNVFTLSNDGAPTKNVETTKSILSPDQVTTTNYTFNCQ
ncbi:MAG: hypothetical protein V4543_00175 [Bacteroidota bacterium]